MRKMMTLLLMALIPAFAIAQNDAFTQNISSRQKDSLRRAYFYTQSDTTKMKVSRSLGFYYQEINRDSSLYFHESQLRIARKLKMKLWQVDALDQGGWVLSELKNHPRSLTYFLEASKILNGQDCEKDAFFIATFFKGKNPKTVKLTMLGFWCNDFSQLYDATGEMAQKARYLHKGYKIGKQLGNDAILSLTTLNLSDVHYEKTQIDSALIYGLQSINYMKRSGYRTYYGLAHVLVGNAYMKLGKHDLAKRYFDKSVAINIRDNNRVKLSNSYYSLAEFFATTNQVDSAITYFNKARNNYQSMGELEQLNQTYNSLYLLYKKKAVTDSAAHYAERSKILGDSLYKADRRKILEYQNIGFNEQIKQQEAEQERIAKANTIKSFTMLATIAIFMLIAFLLYRNVTNRKKANELLQQQKEKIQLTLDELKATQSQLIQSEKMASLGELTAGIAHEIQNPLNFVNNFSDVSNELIVEIEEERGKIQDSRDETLINDNLKDIKQNLEKISHHGKRADAIVKGMLQHSRSSSSTKEPTDINKLVDEYLRLAYHGLRAKDNSFNAELITNFDKAVTNVNIVPQDIGRVLLNLFTNAFYATHQKQKINGSNYKPTVTVSTSQNNDYLQILVNDNGTGIPEAIKDKILQPFFTTKPTGEGTGLGLSLSYDIIVKAHGGQLNIETEEGEWSEFKIELPLK